MRVLSIVCLTAAGLLAPSARADGLLFQNGDSLNGKLLSIDAQEIVHWQHPDAKASIEFKRGDVAQIDLPPQPTPDEHSGNACRILLADGGTLTGTFVSCADDGLILQTWYAGKLEIPRDRLQSLVFLPRSPEVFDGITGMDGWTQGTAVANIPGETGQWIYRNGAFYADKPASIARDLKLPDVAEIQFDLAWKGSLNLAVALYTDSLRPILLTAKDDGPNFGAFYSLRFLNSAFIDMWPIKKGERVRELGQLFYPALNSKARVHVDILVSKPQQKITLLLDHNLVKEWQDPEGFIGQGTDIRFVQNSSGPIKLNNLRVTHWDGILQDAPSEATKLTHDTVWPDHGNAISGTLNSFTADKINIRTVNSAIDIPVNTVRSVDFAHQPVGPLTGTNQMVRATFAEGGTITFSLDTWKPDGISAHSRDFGHAHFLPSTFTRLQFFIPDDKLPKPDPLSSREQ